MGIHDVTSTAISGCCAYKVAIMSLKVNGEKGFYRINSLFLGFLCNLFKRLEFSV